VRNIVTETVKNQNLRLAATAAKKRTVTLTNLITIEDVKGFKLDKDADSIFTKKGIGFQKRPHGMADNS
jgi:hypothetical protein